MTQAMKRALSSSMPRKQTDALQELVTKHVADTTLHGFANSTDFSATSAERGLQLWEQAHLVAALDVINSYQRERRARSTLQLASVRMTRSKDFSRDPRTRLCELLKRWLRTRAAQASVGEEDVRGMSGLCRDLLNHPQLFPARNPRSFLQTVAEVHEHLQRQLKEVLERDRSCSELVQRILMLSRNLLSDTLAFLLMSATDLRQTDALPSLEVVALWKSLPSTGAASAAGAVAAVRPDEASQRGMRDAWSTRVGGLADALLRSPECVQLFGSRPASSGAATRAAAADGPTGEGPSDALGLPPTRDPAASSSRRSVSARRRPSDDSLDTDKIMTSVEGGPEVLSLLHEAAASFARGDYKNSGLAGAFRDVNDSKQEQIRQSYLDCFRGLSDLMFLLSEVLTQFSRVGDGLGDYGMIRMSPWLHPFLDALADKVKRLKANMEQVNGAVEDAYTLGRARGLRVARPAPSDRMRSRSQACIDRAVGCKGGHAQELLQSIEDLRARSAPERLPALGGALGDACSALHAVLRSAAFRAAVGEGFPELPPPPTETYGTSATEALTLTVARPTAAAATTSPALAAAPDFAKAASELGLRGPQRERSGRSSTPAGAASSRSSSPGSEPTTAASADAEASEPPSSDWPSADEPAASAPQIAEAFLVTPSRISGNFKRRDRRALRLQQGTLIVSEATPHGRPVANIDLCRHLESFDLRQDVFLTIVFQCVPEGASLADGVLELQELTFEFDTPDNAARFSQGIQDTRIRGVASWRFA